MDQIEARDLKDQVDKLISKAETSKMIFGALNWSQIEVSDIMLETSLLNGGDYWVWVDVQFDERDDGQSLADWLTKQIARPEINVRCICEVTLVQ